jgi:uncharacterized protein YggT (Ycf19 family)
MEFIALPVFVFLELVKILIFLEIIFSLLSLLGIFVAIPFVTRIVHPLFHFVRTTIPTQFSGLDFSALVLLILIAICQRALIGLAPEILIYLPQSGIF